MHFVPLHNPYDLPTRTERYRRMIETNFAMAIALWDMVETYHEEGLCAKDQPSMVYEAIKQLRRVGHEVCIDWFGERD